MNKGKGGNEPFLHEKPVDPEMKRADTSNVIDTSLALIVTKFTFGAGNP
jgi:hypothetical protein